MRADGPTRVAYVVKRYPRFSETFVVNEILAHEAAGIDVEIFSLYPPNDTHFQDAISRVRAPVTYLTAESLRGVDLWSAIESAGTDVPFLWRSLDLARGAEARVVYQGAWLAREIRRRGITHVHAHFATASAEVARLAAGWAHVPFTVTAHAKDIFHESVAPERLRRVLSAAHRVVTVSDFNVEYLTRVVGLDESLVTRIYNGLDLERFAPVAADGARVPRIVSVGRFVVKNLSLNTLVGETTQLLQLSISKQATLEAAGRLNPATGTISGTIGRNRGPTKSAEIHKSLCDNS